MHTLKNTAANLLVQHKNIIQARTMIIHYRLAIDTQLCNRDKKIPVLCITIKAIESCMDKLNCMMAEERKIGTVDNEYLDTLSELILHCWSSRDEIEIINGNVMRSKKIIVLTALQNKAPKQLHLYYMGKEKTKLLARGSIWVNMNNDIEEMMKSCPTRLDFQATQ